MDRRSKQLSSNSIGIDDLAVPLFSSEMMVAMIFTEGFNSLASAVASMVVLSSSVAIIIFSAAPTLAFTSVPFSTGLPFTKCTLLPKGFISYSSEMIDGRIEKVKKIRDRKPVEEYLMMQGRFKHLFSMEGGEEEIARIQAIADWNAEYSRME